jgi:hypothetical protein
MSKTNDINEKIKALEEQKEKLLLLRRDEIFSILKLSGGIALDNRLLAGLAVYASSKADESSGFLKELFDLGEKKMPSKRRSADKNKSIGKGLEENSSSSLISANAT